MASPHPHPPHNISATNRPMIWKGSWAVAEKLEGMCSTHTHTHTRTHTRTHTHTHTPPPAEWRMVHWSSGKALCILERLLVPLLFCLLLPPFPHLIFASIFGPVQEQKVHPRLTQFPIPPSVWSPLLAKCSWHLGALFNTKQSQYCLEGRNAVAAAADK